MRKLRKLSREAYLDTFFQITASAACQWCRCEDSNQGMIKLNGNVFN